MTTFSTAHFTNCNGIISEVIKLQLIREELKVLKKELRIRRGFREKKMRKRMERMTNWEVKLQFQTKIQKCFETEKKNIQNEPQWQIDKQFQTKIILYKEIAFSFSSVLPLPVQNSNLQFLIYPQQPEKKKHRLRFVIGVSFEKCWHLLIQFVGIYWLIWRFIENSINSVCVCASNETQFSCVPLKWHALTANFAYL